MKNIKSILLAILLLLITTVSYSQITGTSGNIKVALEVNLPTPNPSQNEAIISYSENDATIRVWDIVNSEWIGVKTKAELVSVLDGAGNFTSTDVEGALAELATLIVAASHDPVTFGTGSSTALTRTNQELVLTDSQLEINLDVDDLKTLSGVTGGDTNLGTFTGNIITDNVTIKTALQELEVSVEDNVLPITPEYASDADAGTGGVAIGEVYWLSTSNVYGQTGFKKRIN